MMEKKIDTIDRMMEKKLDKTDMVLQSAKPNDECQTQRWGSWSVDCAFPLLLEEGEDAETRVQGKASVLDTDRITSISSAVQMLNAGTLTCEEDFCVVFSQSLQSYYVLFRADQQAQALNAFGLDEGSEVAACLLYCQQLLGQGIDDRVNKCVLFKADNSSGKVNNRIVVYFPGDVQDCAAADMRDAGYGDFEHYNLPVTARRLASKHNASSCLCIRADVLLKGVQAAYQNFCPLWEPDHSAVSGYDGLAGRATEHLVALLENCLGEAFETAEIEIVTFSRGCVVLNQLIAELSQPIADLFASGERVIEPSGKQRACQRLWTRVSSLHNVDGANIGGPCYPYADDTVIALHAWMVYRRIKGTPAVLHLPVGTHVHYRSIPHNAWIEAVVTGYDGNRYGLDLQTLDHSQAEADPMDVRLPIGTEVEYLSSRRGYWVPGIVKEYDSNSYHLDVRAVVDPTKVRLRKREAEKRPQAVAWHVHYTPYTLLGIPGKYNEQRHFIESVLTTYDDVMYVHLYHQNDESLAAHFKTLEDYVVPNAEEQPLVKSARLAERFQPINETTL